MSNPKLRGISIVRTIKVSEPNRKEPVLVKKMFQVRCNAEIPLDHKDFQNQVLSENYVPKLPAPKKKHFRKRGEGKFMKHKNNYVQNQ